jgi:sigma-B regulation protein RsbU (phosphoserine phosphatase)
MLRMQDRVREIAVDLSCADGRRLPVLVNAVTKTGGDGEADVVRIAVFDATERRSYERELLAARERAEQSEARAQVLAQTLQASLIPPEPPKVPGLDVGGAYRPAGAGDEVGGDFYDVFEIGAGEWGIALGDVCGKGAAAATVTALARYTIRAAAVQDPSPAHVLDVLNDAIVRHHGDRFCTAVYVRAATATGRTPRLTVCVGGHASPLLVGRGSAPRPLGIAGTLLGMFDDIDVHEVAADLEPGQALVLFTDGVTEARNAAGAFYGEAALRSVLEAVVDAPAQAMADHVVGDVLAFQGGIPRDDIAVVVLRAPG